MMSDKARAERIKKAVDAHPDEGERLHLQYQGRAIDRPVVSLPVDALVYNPRSHRIQAQLESDGSLHQVEQDPFAEASQVIIEDTLRATEGYGELRDSLALEGQRDAGVVTDAGVLINGNTRVAALVELKEKYVRVAVLPGDAGEEEINDLELRLQVAKDFRQPYTFTNKLLFIKELSDRHNRSYQEIAASLGLIRSNERRELDRAEAEIQQSLRLLALIRDLQRLAPAGALKLVDFDDDEQALTEIDARYESSRGADEAAALAVRNARLLGVLCSLGYRELREIQHGFVDEYLASTLTESEVLGPVVDDLLAPTAPVDSTEVPGLDILGQPDDAGTDLTPTLELVLSTTGQPTIEVGDETIDRDAFMSALNAAMDDAAHEARADRKSADRILAPVKFMREAGRSISRCLAAFQRVEDEPEFDDSAFDDAVRHSHRALIAVAERAGIVLGS